MGMSPWGTPDVLGSPFESVTMPMGADEEGQVVATLVRCRAPSAERGAVLYVHGYNDYFFQTHLASFYTSRGLNFYALDLRKYGRSIRPYQTPYYCRSLADYFPELSSAVNIIRERDGNERLLVNGHSLGGLITALWVNEMNDRNLVDALFLNSPLLDFRDVPMARATFDLIVRPLARFYPKAKLPPRPSNLYGRSLHSDYNGAWEYNQEWKSTTAPYLRAGWLAAVDDGIRRVRAGLSIDVPILVMCAARGIHARQFSADFMQADCVLDPVRIARQSASLGRQVTCIRVVHGMHDLALSEVSARTAMFDGLDRWLRTYFLV
jgi:alpha-beta hydrolase superfamily lysophospholipase